MSLRPWLERPLLRAVGLLAVLAYLPALTAAPGRMPADSKLYLYLDPARFLGDAASTFDPNQFAGWVPHQHVAYLWPSGPWFWLFETAGFPDWIAHRLWIGSLMLAAGLGVRWCARVLGLGQAAALAAAVLYQVSPYVLPYVSRTSVMLLPWAGLGWIVGLTIRAAQRHTWRDPALLALVVFTVGAVNVTALAMIVPAPTLWLLHAVWLRTLTWRQAAMVVVRVAALTIPVCLWWIVMLVIQGRYGAEVLPYSESLADVSLTATSSEVWRSLGYWLFYVRDPYAATTTESLRYVSSTPAIVVSYAVPLACLAALAWVRWAHRRYALLLVAAGALLAVGVHPVDDRSPLMRVLAGSDDGGLALALRSSTRALPVMNLGLALGAGAGVAACRRLTLRHIRWPVDRLAAAGVVVLALLNLPGLWTGAFVDPALERDQSPPQAWDDAVEALDASGTAGRVLQVPGAEFGAFRWGYTVDQPLPGLTEKPAVTRDLLPLGSPGAMDLLYALDDRFQDGTFEPASIGPVARWLGVDTLWVANDIAFDRFRTARPEVVAAQIDGAPGVGPAQNFGPPGLNRPAVPVTDERALGDPATGAPVHPVVLHGLDDPGTVVRAGDEIAVVSGSGDGLVDLAAAGILDGNEIVRYTATLDRGAMSASLTDAGELIVTDSNRDRARHWRSSQDTVGYTESDQPDLALLRDVASDQRLPVFTGRGDETDPLTQTVARQIGDVIATATSYGEPFAYLPEHRPVMAIDGDRTTAWTVGEHADPVGETLRLRFADPVFALLLTQPDRPDARRITAISMRSDDAEPVDIELDEQSLTPDGHRISLPDGAQTVDITIAAVAGGEPFSAGAVAGVGFAEVSVGFAPTVEVVRPPHDALMHLDPTTGVTLAFTRLRTDPMDRWRDDPEPVLIREFDLTTPRTVDVDVEVRVDARATDADLADLLGWPATASSRLTGSLRNAGIAAIDGDPETAWITAFGAATGATLTIDGVADPVEQISIRQPVGGFSTITAITVRSGGDERRVALELDAAGAASAALVPPLAAGSVEIELSEVDAATTVDRRFGDTVELPAAISEVVLAGLPAVTPIAATDASFECVPLLDVDGRELAFSFEFTALQLEDGAAADATPCSPPVALQAGTVRVMASNAAKTPFTVDRVLITDRARRAVAIDETEPVIAQVVDGSRFDRTIEVAGCRRGCWLVLGEGYSTGWSASIAGVSLGVPQLVDGGFNGWLLPASSGTVVVDVRWGPQRWLTFAFALSLVGVAVAVALAVRRGRGPATGAPMAEPRWVPAATLARRGIDHPRVLAIGGTWAALAGLLIEPRWAVWGLLAGAAAALSRRARIIELTALATVATLGAVVTAREMRNDPAPGGGWPALFDDLHGVGMFAIVTLIVAAVFADDVPARSYLRRVRRRSKSAT